MHLTIFLSPIFVLPFFSFLFALFFFAPLFFLCCGYSVVVKKIVNLIQKKKHLFFFLCPYPSSSTPIVEVHCLFLNCELVKKMAEKSPLFFSLFSFFSFLLNMHKQTNCSAV